MPDFWLTSGYNLLEPNEEGRLMVTDDYARAFWRRPEVAPVEESCKTERALHERMVNAPFAPLPKDMIDRVEDRDAAENYQVVAGFLGGLKKQGSVERYYASLFQGQQIAIPPMFIDQMVHALLRHILHDQNNPLAVRAAEIFFRSQRVTIQDDHILLADDDTVEMFSQTGGFGDLGRLLVEGNAALKEIELDVLSEENAAIYWARSDRFDTVIDITFPRPGLDAFCRVMEAWVLQFVGLETRIHPVQSIRDERWRWHIGLDGRATEILNGLYKGDDLSEESLADVLNLFRMEVKDSSALIEEMQGKPIYLGLAKTPDGRLQMKPQNLLTNLPLARAA